MTKELAKMQAPTALRMGPNISMPPRSTSPGLKWRTTVLGRQPYWAAKQVVRDPKGFPDKTVRLPANASDDEIGELCREHTALLLKWIEDVESGRDPDIRYDGTVKSLSQLYQKHPESPFHEVKRNTRESYVD